jgi:hypothetical protein
LLGLELGGLLGLELGGFDDGGVCAASVPHSATPLHSVTAHCQRCVFFMMDFPLLRV